MPVSQPSPVPNLVTSAQNLNVDHLKWYLGPLTERIPTRKGELAVKYVAALTDKVTVQRLWRELTPIQQQVVAEIAYAKDGRYQDELLEAKYPEAKPPINPQGYHGLYWSFGTGRDKHDAEPYDVFFVRSYEYGVYMPSDLAAIVRTITPEPPPFTLRSSEEPPTIQSKAQIKFVPNVHISTTERTVFHDIAATLFMVQEGKVAISASTKTPTLATLRALRGRLLLGDYMGNEPYARAEDASRPFALIMLVQAARWADVAPTGNKLELTKIGETLVYSPIQATQVREAWERWIKSDLLDELSRVRAIKGQQSKETKLTKPTDRRKQIATLLKECPLERWINLDDFLRYLRATDRLPAIERNSATMLHLGSSGEYGWLGYADIKYWDIVNGSYIRAFLWEFAATLGIVEMTYTSPEESVHDFGNAYGLDEGTYLSRFDGLMGFRITPLGAYALGLTDDYTPPESGVEAGPTVLTILPNLDIVVVNPLHITVNDRTILERIGVEQNTNVYHLQRDLVLDALERGLMLDQIKAFLAGRSGVAQENFPQTVQVFLDEVERRASVLRDAGRMSIIEGDDALLLTELAHSTELRASVRLATIGDRTVLLVPEDREAAVRKGLRKLGYLPRKS